MEELSSAQLSPFSRLPLPNVGRGPEDVGSGKNLGKRRYDPIKGGV